MDFKNALQDLIKEKQAEIKNQPKNPKPSTNVLENLKNGVVTEDTKRFLEKQKTVMQKTSKIYEDDVDAKFDEALKNPKIKNSSVNFSQYELTEKIKEEVKKAVDEKFMTDKNMLKESFAKTTEIVLQPYIESLIEKIVEQKVRETISKLLKKSK